MPDERQVASDLPVGAMFGDLLRELRENAGFSQLALAEQCELSVRALRNIERGLVARPHPATLQRLVDALGLPAAVSQRLHAVARGLPVDPPPSRIAVVAQLPRDTGQLVGRGAEIGELDRLMGRPPGIIMVCGPAGVGKTALAVHWAHRAAGRFPDGQLFIDLRGFDSTEEPLRPLDALRRLLSALEPDTSRLATNADEVASYYRSHLATRRLVVVLDNAHSSAQVRALLPGTSRCLVLVTSRRRLDGLAARDGAVLLPLGPLPESAAMKLVRTTIEGSPAFTSQHPDDESLRSLSRLCGGLPLTLRVAATRLVARNEPIGSMLHELGDDRIRLRTLRVDEDDASLTVLFDGSLRAMTPAAAQSWMSLGMHPGEDFDGHVVSALSGVPLDTAQRHLDDFVALHLVTPYRADRYRMHDLVDVYCTRLADSTLSTTQRADILDRLCRFYLAAVLAAENTIRPRNLEVPPPADHVHHGLDLHSPESAAQWLLSEQANLAALVRLVQRERLRPYAWQLPHALAGSYQRQGLWEMWLSSHRSALDLMPDHSDPPRHAVLCGLGIAHAQLNQLSAARDCFTRALELCDPTGDVEPRARYVTNLGGVAYQLGQFEEALNLFREGLHLRSGEGDGSSAATSTTNVGIALSALGRTAEAKALLEQALAVFRQTGDVGAEIHVMIALGDACARVAPGERTRWYNSAITSARGIGDRFHEADALQSLGHALPAGQGAVHLRQALKIFQQLGHPRATMVANELAGRRGTNRHR